MNCYIYIILFFIGVASCNFESDFPKYLESCDFGNPSIDRLSYRDSTNLYELKIPGDWKVQTSINKPYRICTFQDTIVDLYNFEFLTITDDIRYEGYDHNKSFEEVLKKIKNNNELEIIERGEEIIDFKRASWILYQSSEYAEDNLENIVFTVLIENENHYFWILANVLGNKETNSRMCDLVKIINSFKIKKMDKKK